MSRTLTYGSTCNAADAYPTPRIFYVLGGVFHMPCNIYGPDQLRRLQTAFDRVWYLVGPTYSLSRDHVAQLIIALAADCGADGSEEIDVDSLVQEALATVMENAERLKQHEAWSAYSRQRASRVWSLNGNVKPALSH